MLAVKRLEDYKTSQPGAQKGTGRGRVLKMMKNPAQVVCLAHGSATFNTQRDMWACFSKKKIHWEPHLK